MLHQLPPVGFSVEAMSPNARASPKASKLLSTCMRDAGLEPAGADDQDAGDQPEREPVEEHRDVLAEPCASAKRTAGTTTATHAGAEQRAERLGAGSRGRAYSSPAACSGVSSSDHQQRSRAWSTVKSFDVAGARRRRPARARSDPTTSVRDQRDDREAQAGDEEPPAHAAAAPRPASAAACRCSDADDEPGDRDQRRPARG